jgi:hypothetical protein
MEKKFVAPASTFISGVGLWIILVVLKLTGSGMVMDWPWLAPAMCIAAGVMILISGIACITAGGPAMGQIVRLVVLMGLLVYTHLSVGVTASIGILITAFGEVVLCIVAFRSGKARGETDTE